MADADVLWCGIGALYLAVTAIAVAQIFRTSELSGIAGGAWLLAVIVIPVIGPLAWFVLHPAAGAKDPKGH